MKKTEFKPILEEVKNNPKVKEYIEKADMHLGAIGYTEHGFRHAEKVGETAFELLLKLGYSEEEAELAFLAGYLHDIGNVVGRVNHGQTGAILAQEILDGMKIETKKVVIVMSAIGNHEEDTGEPTNPVSAALIIADKTDVHRTRVRNPKMVSFDIHDRVNYAVTESNLFIDPYERNITLHLKIDTQISQVMEYFEIFLSRMIICRKAARFLEFSFHITINEMRMS